MAKNKKNPNAQYAFIGLIITGLACASTALVAAAKSLFGLGIASDLGSAYTENINLALQISVALIFVGLAVFAILNPEGARRALTGRRARYGSNSLVMTLGFLGIIFAANYIAYNNPGLLNAPWDFTEDQSNTLSPESLQILATLPDKVMATGFYSASLGTGGAEPLLLKFKSNSNGKFDFKFIDPDQDPLAAKQAGITGDGKILLTMGDRKEIASFASEEEVARALIRLVDPEPRAVYFLQGHGEPAIDRSGDENYSRAKETLESKNYTVGTINLLTNKSIPEDALAIIIAGPKKPLAQSEVNLLKDFVNKGGALFVMEDPVQFTEFGESPDPLKEYLLADWGIQMDNKVVIDLENSQNAIWALSSQFNSSHPITRNLTSNYIVILPQTQSLSILPLENITATPVLLTTQNSWGESNLQPGTTPDFKPEEGDVQGPLNLAVAAENSNTKGRVVVIGSSLYASDGFFDAYGNGNMFANSVDWAAEQENLINITPREGITRIYSAPAGWNFLIIVLLTVFVLPGLAIVFGVTSWLQRRKRG